MDCLVLFWKLLEKILNPFDKLSDEALRKMSAVDFITRIFVEGLGARYIVVGDDLRFGHDREGDFSLMQEQGIRFGYETMHTATLGISGTRVSSTRVREALDNADMRPVA